MVDGYLGLVPANVGKKIKIKKTYGEKLFNDGKKKRILELLNLHIRIAHVVLFLTSGLPFVRYIVPDI